MTEKTYELEVYEWTAEATGIHPKGVVILTGKVSADGLVLSAFDATRLGVDLIKAAAAFELSEDSEDPT